MVDIQEIFTQGNEKTIELLRKHIVLHILLGPGLQLKLFPGRTLTYAHKTHTHTRLA